MYIASFHWNESNLMQAASSLNQSHVQLHAYIPTSSTFPLQVHYKAIKILAVRWVGTRLLMHIFTETTTSDKSWAVSWERRRSQYVQSYSFPNILLDGWEGLKAYTLKKKGSLKVHTFKKISAARSAAKLLHILPAAIRAMQHGLYTLNLLPTPML